MQHLWIACILALASSALGCGRGAATEPAGVQRESARPDERSAGAPEGAPPREETAATSEEVADPTSRELVPGRGSCSRDDECVLSSYQEGCCVQACSNYATSRIELERRQQAEDCAAFHASGKRCAPPAPCRPSTREAVSAVCSQGQCAAVVEASR